MKRDLKNLTNAIASDIINEINALKDAIEKQNKRFSQELKSNSLDTAEKANQLSLYIDDQIKQLSEENARKNEKLKQIFTKLAEQLKNHLITYDVYKRELSSKTLTLEKALEEERVSLTKSLTTVENSLKTLIKDAKFELESLLLSKFSVVADKCLKLQAQLDSDIDLVKETIDNSRSLLLNKINKVVENYGELHQKHFENSRNCLILVDELKNSVKTLANENSCDFNEVCEKLVEIEARNCVENIAEKTLRESQFTDFFKILRETAEEIHKGMFNLKILVENEERTRVFEKEQVNEGLEQLNAKIDNSKEDFDKFFNDFKVIF